MLSRPNHIRYKKGLRPLLATCSHPWKSPQMSNVRFRYITRSGAYSTTAAAAPHMASGGLPELPDVERLSPRVLRVLGGNPSKFTLQGTNTYIVGTGPSRLLIDTAHGRPAWISSLQRVLSSENASIDAAIITHWHPDHVGGIADLLQLNPSAKVYKHDPWEGQLPIADGQRFAAEGATLRALHCPGHTADHVALVLEEEDAIFTGDNVLGHGTAVFEDLAVYVASLARMAGEASGRGYPAHGAVIPDAPGKIREYIAHRREREAQVLEILGRPREAGQDDTVCETALDVTKFIYTELGPDMYPAAEKGIRLILDKLEGEGKVVHVPEGDRWQLVAEPQRKPGL